MHKFPMDLLMPSVLFDLGGVSEILSGGRASYLKIDFKPITKPLPPLVQQLPD